jgi:hypothetical protein
MGALHAALDALEQVPIGKVAVSDELVGKILKIWW